MWQRLAFDGSGGGGNVLQTGVPYGHVLRNSVLIRRRSRSMQLIVRTNIQ